MTKTSATICFVARNDFEEKPGGDTVQWRIYERVAQAAGFSTNTWFSDAPQPDADIYHAFNIDRPLEIYPRLKAAARAGKPYIISTIHHPNPWLKKFRATHPPSGRLGRLLYQTPLGNTVARSESIKEVARIAQQRRFGQLSDLYPSWTERIRWLLREAHQVWLLSNEEGRWLDLDFGFRTDKRAVVVPNWVEGIAASGAHADSTHSDEPAPVLVVGRVEARKNVLRVLRLAEEVGRRLVFIGRGNPNESLFVDEFRRRVEQSKYCKWIPGVPRAELGVWYARAAFLLNASYVEVSPLVDIEAMSFGCPVATTQYALHHELLPRDLRAVDPYDDADIREVLSSHPRKIGPTTVIHPGQVQAELLTHYRKLLIQ